MGLFVNMFIVIVEHIMNFFIKLVIAREVGEGLYGDYSVTIEGLLLISTFLTLGIDSTILYYVPKFFVNKKYAEIRGLLEEIKQFLKPLYLSISSIGLILAVSLTAAILALEDFTFYGQSHPIVMFLWGTVCISIYNIFSAYLRSINLIRFSILIDLLRTTIYFIIGVGIYFLLFKTHFVVKSSYFPHFMLTGFLGSYILCSLIAGMGIKVANDRNQNQMDVKIKHPWKKKLVGYTLQNILIFIFSAIPLFMIELVGQNEQDVGLFAAVIAIINIAYIGILPLGFLLEPKISSIFTAGKAAIKHTLIQYLSISVSIALVIVLVFFIFSYKILLLYKYQFIDALPYLHYCLTNILLLAIGLVLTKFILYSKDGSVYSAKLAMVLFPFQCLVSFVLIAFYGLLGAVLSYITIYIVYVSSCIFLFKKILDKID